MTIFNGRSKSFDRSIFLPRLSARLMPPSRQEAQSSMAPVTEAPLASEASTLQVMIFCGSNALCPSAAKTPSAVAEEDDDEVLSPTPTGRTDLVCTVPEYSCGSFPAIFSASLTVSLASLRVGRFVV